MADFYLMRGMRSLCEFIPQAGRHSSLPACHKGTHVAQSTGIRVQPCVQLLQHLGLVDADLAFNCKWDPF